MAIKIVRTLKGFAPIVRIRNARTRSEDVAIEVHGKSTEI